MTNPPMYSGGGSTPIPDPTARTAEAVRDATEQWQKDLNGLREIIDTRLAGMDKAVTLHAEVAGQVTGRIERQLAHLEALVASELRDAVSTLDGRISLAEAGTQRVADVSLEKFLAIDGTFASNALALTAALAAQKEAAAEQNKSGTLAITKSEQTTKETINSNAIQTTASLQSQAALITDVKERVVRIEQSIVNLATNRTDARDDRTEHRGSTQGVTQIVAVGIAVLAIAVALVLGLRTKASGTVTELPSCKEVSPGVTCVQVK